MNRMLPRAARLLFLVWGVVTAAAHAAAPVPTAAELMDWAERAYPQFFPATQPTQSLPPYLYRYYPQTGNYLGVAGQEVYVLGSLTGGTSNPVRVGALGDFACQVAPAACSVASTRHARMGGGLGAFYTLAVKPDGSVWAAGANEVSQFGEGLPSLASPVMRQVAPAGTALRAVVAPQHSSVLARDGRVLTAGMSNEGVLGNGQAFGFTMARSAATVIDQVRALASNASTQVAVRTDGSAWRWGRNLGGTAQDLAFGAVRIDGVADVVDVAMTDHAAILLRRDGTVWAWGANDMGALGPALAVGASSGPQAVQVTGLQDVVALAAGRSFSMALKADGSIWTWGSNSRLTLGESTRPGIDPLLIARVPAAVPGVPRDVTGIAAGDATALAVHLDGTVSTWGADAGRWCRGLPGDQLPGKLPQVSDADGVAGAGPLGFFIIRRNGSVSACGSNGPTGQLGVGRSDVFEIGQPTLLPGFNLN